VTLAWPGDHNDRVALEGLPSPHSFSGVLTELAVFGMSAYGTCTKNYGVFSLRSGFRAPAGEPPVSRSPVRRSRTDTY
jgi:hypothetical protein